MTTIATSPEREKLERDGFCVFDDVLDAELVAAPGALRALEVLGYDNPKWASGYVISKPPHSPALFWRGRIRRRPF
jgi:hypothetical protein